MKDYLVDVPVVLVFFNRPEVFAKVFDCVRQNRPSTLFLIQDGPRSNKPGDIEKIRECREIVGNIDWECNVHYDYSDINLGCGQRVFTGLTNAFKYVDRLVVVEDDIIFNDSFLPFCKEMLERYENDERICLVSGMNQLGHYRECPYSYFFSQGGGAIWGWATWKRVWDRVNWNLPEAKDEYLNKVLLNNHYYGKRGEQLSTGVKRLAKMIEEGKSPSYWSLHFGYYSYINNQINVVPTYNLISNIGLTNESAHAVDSLKKLPGNTRKLFFTKMYDLKTPLIHPTYVIDDKEYFRRQTDLMSPRGIKRLYYLAEYLLRRLIYR